jgi:hypothetical protein
VYCARISWLRLPSRADEDMPLAALPQSSGSQDVFGQLLVLGSVWFENLLEPSDFICLLFVFGWTWEGMEPLPKVNIRLDVERLHSKTTGALALGLVQNDLIKNC